MKYQREKRWWKWECVGCGQRYAEPQTNHKCSPKRVAAIEAVHRRAADPFDDESDWLPPEEDPRQFSYNRRLADGFALIRGDMDDIGRFATRKNGIVYLEQSAES